MSGIEIKSWARGGPKSKRRLKQADITKLDSPVKDVARSVIDRPRKKSKGSPEGKTHQREARGDDDELSMLSPRPAKVLKSTQYKQSHINFDAAVLRKVAGNDVDEEIEAFRSSQMASGRSTQAVDHATVKEKGKPRVKRIVHRICSDEDSEDGLITPQRRRQRFMPTSKEDEDEDEKIEVDLDNKRIKLNNGGKRSNNSKNTFRDNLLRLQRKKQGLPSESSASAESDSEELQVLEEFEDDDDDFIVETDNIGDDMPLAFQQPRSPLDQFKIACQWEILDLLMPQGGVQPDEYFNNAIKWMRDKTQDKSQAATSSIWRRTFIRALQRGHILEGIETGNLGFFCDACGRTNRVATHIVKFQGTRYDRLTLEDLDSDADSSEDDLHIDENAADDPEEERDRQERLMRQEWNLGVNCYERTCIAHELFHLRKHLRDEISEKLGKMGLFTAAKKYERSIMASGDRIELANKVTEELDAARFQERLWSRFKSTIETSDDFLVGPGTQARRKFR